MRAAPPWWWTASSWSGASSAVLVAGWSGWDDPRSALMIGMAFTNRGVFGVLSRERRVDVRPVISASHPLAQAEQAIRLARDKTRSMKIHLVPN